jgi:hypothetical protein
MENQIEPQQVGQQRDKSIDDIDIAMNMQQQVEPQRENCIDDIDLAMAMPQHVDQQRDHHGNRVTAIDTATTMENQVEPQRDNSSDEIDKAANAFEASRPTMSGIHAAIDALHTPTISHLSGEFVFRQEAGESALDLHPCDLVGADLGLSTNPEVMEPGLDKGTPAKPLQDEGEN